MSTPHMQVMQSEVYEDLEESLATSKHHIQAVQNEEDEGLDESSAPKAFVTPILARKGPFALAVVALAGLALVMAFGKMEKRANKTSEALDDEFIIKDNAPVDKCGLHYCDTWCNTPGKWGCGIASHGKYTCNCTGCNGCGVPPPLCKTKYPGYCHNWCNTTGKWGCGVASRDVGHVRHTCDCTDCNGCTTTTTTTTVAQCIEHHCSSWCNTPGKWGCGVASDGMYTCDCTGCNGCGEATTTSTTTVPQCVDKQGGILSIKYYKFCSEWCNTPDKWGCGISRSRSYVCDCTGCNGCEKADGE